MTDQQSLQNKPDFKGARLNGRLLPTVSAEDKLLDVRAILAGGVATGFLLICVATFALVAMTTGLESWAAGIVGAVVGYWANNLTQVISFYFGSSQSNKENRQTIDRMVETQTDAAKVLAEKVAPQAGAVPTDVVQPVKVMNKEPVEVAVVQPATPEKLP